MIESICLAGMLFANFWATDSFNPEQCPCPGTAISPEVSGTGAPVQFMCPLKLQDHPTCPAPGHAEILRALPPVARGVPYVCEQCRDDIEFKVEKLVDRVDPPRFFPLIGPAQLHHCHWKCTVFFTDVTDASYPWPFRAQRRRMEVVYIDKDHLQLCAAPSDAASAEANGGSCAGGRFKGKETPNSAVKCDNGQQVQIEVVVARVDKSALPKIASSFGVLKSKEKLLASLQKLRSDGLAKILAEPRVTTLSGQMASIISGAEVPIRISDRPGARSVTYKHVGTEISLLPIVKDNGRIHLEIRSQITSLDHASGTETAPGFKTRQAVVAVVMEAGHTLTFGSGYSDDDMQETVTLVTPRLVTSTPGTAAPPVVQLPRTEECPRAFRTIRSMNADRERSTTIDDVVKMSQSGISSKIILRQIELTNAVFNLAVDDIIYLHQQGVSDDIISAMQECRAGSAITLPRQPEGINVLPSPPISTEPGASAR